MSILFSQSCLDRLIVPVYIESEVSSGYDNNYLKLSTSEKDDYDLYPILGDSEDVYSSIIKSRTNILYVPYLFNNHETHIDLRMMTTNYLSSELKSYKSYYARISQHLGPYAWLKLSYSYIPSFYLKSYIQTDPYIFNDFQNLSNNYMSASFSSEKIGIEITAPIPYLYKTYGTIKYLSELQYYNADFTEFDLEIKNYYFKIKRKIFKYFNFSIAHMISSANNISYMNGLLSTYDKDRSYTQNKTYISFSINKILLFGKKTSIGLSPSIENRIFSSDIENDILHFNRTHHDVNISYWIKRYLDDSIAFKLKGVYRQRNTSSKSDYVVDLKSFDKFEIWVSVIFKMDLNVY